MKMLLKIREALSQFTTKTSKTLWQKTYYKLKYILQTTPESYYKLL